MKASFSIGLICLLGLFVSWSCAGESRVQKLALTIEDWTHEYAPGAEAEIAVLAYCIGDQAWKGEIELRVEQKDSIFFRSQNMVEILADSSVTTAFQIQLPQAEGKYELVGELIHPGGRSIRNRRLIEVKKPLDLSL